MENEEAETLVSSMQDILGINPEDLKNEPQIATFFKMGPNGTNMGSYKVVQFKRNENGQITHALVRPISVDKVYKDGGPKKLDSSNAPKGDFLVPIGELNKLLSQDFAANQGPGL